VYALFRKLRAAVAMGKITPHAFRDSFATHLLENRVDIRVVGDMLGPASIATTRRYAGVLRQLRCRAAQTLTVRSAGDSPKAIPVPETPPPALRSAPY
jgi:integrase/recombinase XerD